MIKKQRLLVGGVMVTYSCLLSRSKLRTAAILTLQEVDGVLSFLLKTGEIFKRVCNCISVGVLQTLYFSELC